MSSTPTLAPVVFLESPYSGHIDRNVRYLLLCGLDSYQRGEMPTSSHGTMTMHPTKRDFFVPDDKPKWDVFTRKGGIDRAQSLRHICSKVVFYIDMGLSPGMRAGLKYCKTHNIPVEIRKLDVDLVVSIGAKRITKELILDILGNKDYTRHFKGTPLLPPSS